MSIFADRNYAALCNWATDAMHAADEFLTELGDVDIGQLRQILWEERDSLKGARLTSLDLMEAVVFAEIEDRTRRNPDAPL